MCFGSGEPLDGYLFDAGAFCRAVAALRAVGRSAIELYEHGIVDIGAERSFDGFQVGFVAEL